MKIWLSVVCLLAYGLHLAQAASVWNRVSTFLVCQQEDSDCNTDVQIVSEIVAITNDGNTAIYTDSEGERLGFVDISDPLNPVPSGTVDLAGEPTSVTVVGNYAVAGVNTSPNFTDPTGLVTVVDLSNNMIVAEIDADGQPDSLATSPDGSYVAVVIENERDEDLGDGAPPQMPPGFVWIIDTNGIGPPNTWTPTRVELTNLATDMKYPEDPEPEYVEINSNNVAVVTLQENNWIALIDCATGIVTGNYSAGSASLTAIDTEDNGLIEFGNLAGAEAQQAVSLLREPDAVTWIGTDYFATADEGDLDGGSRTFTIFALDGTVVYTSGNMLEHLAIRHGHYPEGRSDDKGTEPEGITYFTTEDGTGFLVVLLERSGAAVIFSVDPTMETDPQFVGFLPTLQRPEGVKKIPGKDMFIVACEEDSRDDKVRAGLVFFSYQEADAPTYPVLVSADRDESLGTPIPFSALSGLAASDAAGFPEGTSAGTAGILYSIEDSAYKSSRIFTIDTNEFPYLVQVETRMTDPDGILKDAYPPDEYNGYVLVNDDDTVNMDPEGIAVSYKGGFWVANEGSGTVGDEQNRPIESRNFIVKVSTDGVIESLVTLPDDVNAIQVRFGFEGVAEQGDWLVVAFQRAWGDEENPRIGLYNTMDETWKFFYYPLEDPASPVGGWVGLSDISPLGGGRFLVVERDNQGGPDAAIKRLYEIEFGPCFDQVEEGATLTKTEKRDMIADGDLPALNGWVYEKIEGLAVSSNGRVWVNNDNDGVDDNSGEQYLFDLGTEVIEVTTEQTDCGGGGDGGDPDGDGGDGGDPDGDGDPEDDGSGAVTSTKGLSAGVFALCMMMAVAW